MKPLSRKRQAYVESTLVRLAYYPVMAVVVVGIVLFWWPVMAWNDYWLRRAWRKQWGDAGRVVIPFEPGTPWHEAVIAHWIPRYGDRTSLVDLTALSPKSRSLDARVFRRWQPHSHYPLYVRPPIVIAIPPHGRVATVSLADAMADPVAIERRLAEVARLAFGSP